MRKSLKALAAAAAVFLTACGSSTGGAAAPPGTASVQAETREQEQTKQEQTKQEQGEVTGSSEEEGAEIIGGADGPTAIFIAQGIHRLIRTGREKFFWTASGVTESMSWKKAVSGVRERIRWELQ